MADFLTDDQLTEPKPDTIGGVLHAFGNEMQKALRDKLISEDAYVNGKLAESVDFNVKMFGGNVKFTLSLLDYYDFVNKGVSGTKGSISGSPYRFKYPNPSKKHQKQLSYWARQKGIVSGEENAKRFGYLAGRKMKTYGMKGNHFYDKVVTEDRLKKLRRDLEDVASKNITTLITATANGIFGITR